MRCKKCMSRLDRALEANKKWNNNLEKLKFDMDEIRIFDAFAGVGALHQSLKELGVPVRVTNLSEIDIDAIIAYAGGHIDNFKKLDFNYPSEEVMKKYLIERNIGYNFEKKKSSISRIKLDKLKLVYKASVILNNLGDISKIDYSKIEDFDLMNMSFPCTDLSNAGQQRGMKNEDGTPTRSGLYVYSIEAIRVKKPKYVMIENVKALIHKKFIDDFYSVISELEECGYNCYYPKIEDRKGAKPVCLNSKDFGIPQNRERIFVIAIRKDIDNKTFKFPIGKDSRIRLKDVLENQVDEKYYLSKEYMKRFLSSTFKIDNEIKILRTTVGKQAKGTNSRHWVHDVNGIVGALSTTDYKQPKQILNIKDDSIYRHNKLIKIGCIGADSQGNRVYSVNGIGSTQVGQACGLGAKTGLYMDNFGIRKLTPLECWRLQGFRDEMFYKAQELGISDTQLYKQAGNSITVNVLYYIFKNLFVEYVAI